MSLYVVHVLCHAMKFHQIVKHVYQSGAEGVSDDAESLGKLLLCDLNRLASRETS